MTLTPEQAEVVARIQQRMVTARRKPPVSLPPRDRTGAARLRAHVAARYARITGCSVSEAMDAVAEVTGVHVPPTSTFEAWHRLYPDVPAAKERR